MRRGPRVLFLAGDVEPERDGVADYARRLVDSLRGRGVDAVVALPERHGWSVRASAGGIPIVAGWTLPGLLRLGRRIDRLGADVVHIQCAPMSYGSRTVLRRLPVGLRLGGWRGPLAVTLHEYTPPTATAGRPSRALFNRGLWDADMGLLLPAARAIIVTNERHRAALASSPAFAPRTMLIPLAPNLATADRGSTDRARVLGELGLPRDATVALSFGFLHPVKRLGDVIGAVARLRPHRPDLRLVIVGGSDTVSLRHVDAEAYRRSLEGRVARLGLDQVVRFTGHVPEARVSALLGIADVAVQTHADGVSLRSGSLLAALAHGVPTIATATPMPEPGLDDGSAVLRVPPGDEAALATAIERVLSEPPLRTGLVAAGRRVAEGRTWAATAEAHAALYDRLLDRPSPTTTGPATR